MQGDEGDRSHVARPRPTAAAQAAHLIEKQIRYHGHYVPFVVVLCLCLYVVICVTRSDFSEALTRGTALSLSRKLKLAGGSGAAATKDSGDGEGAAAAAAGAADAELAREKLELQQELGSHLGLEPVLNAPGKDGEQQEDSVNRGVVIERGEVEPLPGDLLTT
eukprot:jgi/Mesen1/6822/ME000035S06201